MVAVAHDLQSDAVLVRAAQHGDSDAFALLFRRHYDSVRRTCLRRLRDPRDADEVAQAAFVRAWERIDRCQGDRRFGGWVHVIAHNLCVDMVRHNGRVAPSDFPDDSAPAPVTQQPENFVLRREQSNLVHLALADLPPRQRAAVVARDLHERRPGEIAAALGISVGAVDSLLLRGRRRLAVSLQRLGGEAGATSAASASSVAGVSAGAGRLGGLMRVMEDVINRASYHAAASLGLVPGVAGPAQRALAAATLGGALAVGAALPAIAPIAAPHLPVAVPAVTVSAPAVAAPRTPAPPVAPQVAGPAAPVPARAVGVPVPPALAPAAPATPGVLLHPLTDAARDVLPAVVHRLKVVVGS